MYPLADVQWSDDDDNRKINLVRFNPVPRQWEEGEVFKFDPIEHLIHSVRMSARGREDYIDGAVGWMVNRKNSNWELESYEAMCNARDLGSESW